MPDKDVVHMVNLINYVFVEKREIRVRVGLGKKSLRHKKSGPHSKSLVTYC